MRHGMQAARLVHGVAIGRELEHLDAGIMATAFEDRARTKRTLIRT